MNANKHKKNTDFLGKSELSNFKEKNRCPPERFMTGAFLIKLTQLEKTGSIGKIFIPLGNLKIPFSKLEIVHVFCTIYTFLFGECYLCHFQQINFN